MNSRDVMYIESKSYQLFFYTNNLEEYRLYRSLEEVAKQVKEGNFIRIHKSVLINMEYVDRINNYKVYLKNGMDFDISRERYQMVKMNYESYLGRRRNLEIEEKNMDWEKLLSLKTFCDSKN